MSKELQVTTQQVAAALGVGVALRLEVRANVRGRAAGASELPGPHSSASACGDDGVREAEKWLHEGRGLRVTKRVPIINALSLRAWPRYTDWCRRRDFDAAQEDAALAHRQDCLSWRVAQV